MSYKAFVRGVGESSWVTNALEFDTHGEAEAYAGDLYSRWMGADAIAVVQDPEGSRYDTLPEGSEIVRGSA